MAPKLLWSSGPNKLLFDPLTAHFDFVTNGYVKRNGQTIGLASNIYDGTPLMANFQVTGNLGAGQYVSRTITLGDRPVQPIDLVIRPIPGPLDAPSSFLPLPEGGFFAQAISEVVGPYTLNVGGLKPAGAPQPLKIWLSATHDGSSGVEIELDPIVVELVNLDTDTVVHTIPMPTLTALYTDTLTLHTVTVPFQAIDPEDAAFLGLRISGGTKTSGATLASLNVGTYDYPSVTQVMPSMYAGVGPLALNMAFEMLAFSDQPTSIGELHLLGKVMANVEVIPGVTIDGVDISELEREFTDLRSLVQLTFPSLTGGLEPTIIIGAAEPANPVTNVTKWLDTSNLANPVWRYYNGSAWVTVGGSGPTVDVTYQDITARNLTLTGQVLGNLNTAPGATVSGVDLPALYSTVQGMTSGQLASEALISDKLEVGRFGAPWLTLTGPVGTYALGDTLVNQVVAQPFEITADGSFNRIVIRAKALTAVGKMIVHLREGAPTTEGVEPSLLSTEFTITATDPSVRDYVWNLVRPIYAAPNQIYYLDVRAINGAQLELSVTGDGPGDAVVAPMIGNAFATTAPSFDLDYEIQVGTVAVGELVVYGTTTFFGDLRIMSPDVEIVTTRHTYLEVEDNKVILNAGVLPTDSPTLDAFFEVNRGTQPAAQMKWDEVNDTWVFDQPVSIEGIDISTLAGTVDGQGDDLTTLTTSLQTLLAKLGITGAPGDPNFTSDGQYIADSDTLREAIENLDDALAIEVNDLLLTIMQMNANLGLGSDSGALTPYVDPKHFLASDTFQGAIEKLDQALWVRKARTLGRREDTTTGLTWGWWGGPVSLSGVLTIIPEGQTLVLPANEPLLYIGCQSNGVVIAQTVPWPASVVPMATATTGVSSITSWQDARPDYGASANAGLSFGNTAGTVVEGNDPRLSDVRIADPTTVLVGDVGGTVGATSVDKIQDVPISMTGALAGQVLKVIDTGSGLALVPSDSTGGIIMGLTTLNAVAGQNLVLQGTAQDYLPVSANTATLYKVSVVARAQSTVVDACASFILEFMVNDNGVLALIVGTPMNEKVFKTEVAATTAWEVVPYVDDTTKRLYLKVTGGSDPVKWVARVEQTQVTFAGP